MSVSLSRAWQACVILLLTVMISLNLRILVSVQYNGDDAADNEGTMDANCKSFLKNLGKVQVNPINITQSLLDWPSLNPGQAKMLGFHRTVTGFLTIGIPSIKRQNGMAYLRQTISSIIGRTSTREKSDVVVVIFLADFDADYNNQVVTYLLEEFNQYISMGFIQVVQVSRDFYPPLSKLKMNFNDKTDRVSWRAKQIADFSFMFLYSRNISRYYIQIEDDVICAPNFVPAIREFIKKHTKQWALLEFSELGFIGKLFKSRDLTKLARFMMTFYDEQPIDWLIRYYRMAMAQSKVYLRKPTLFQHIGTTSSFDTSKANKLKDRFFDTDKKKWKSDDPEAAVSTDMKPYQSYGPELVYGAGTGYFWAVSPRKGQALYIIFDNDEQLTRVVVETGSSKRPNDVLHTAVLEASPKLIKIHDNGTASCAGFRPIGTFTGGKVDAQNLKDALGGRTTKCLRILIKEDQADWAVIEQVAVFTNPQQPKT